MTEPNYSTGNSAGLLISATEAAAVKLVDRYNRPGPRYTSYPTVPEWRESAQAELLEQKLAALRQTEPRPLSLYLHIPFCAEICHFCGCNTFQLGDPNYAERYLDYLIREIDLFASRLPAPRAAVQMHWGGGTPTFLTEAQIEKLYRAVTARFNFTPDAEISIELDPRVTTAGQTQLLRDLGFNRVSFGVQDLDLAVQQAANRIQPVEVTQRLFDQCRGLGFSSINVDLIYGLARQTTETFARTIEQVMRWRPDRIALFSYAHVPWLKPFQKKINAAELPPADVKFRTFLSARRAFLDSGYEPIGLDHFAVPQDELAVARREGALRRNFQGYTTLPETNVYAMGISAISDVGDLYVQNHKKFTSYYSALDNGHFAIQRGLELSADDQLRRYVITKLLCNFALDFAPIEQRFGIDFNDYFATELSELPSFINDGLATLDAQGLRVTPLGQLFIRNLCMLFDAHLRRQTAQHQTEPQTTQPKFSRTV